MTPRADSPVQYIKGVGPARARQFADIGIATVGDLLEYFPFRYDTSAGEMAIDELQPGMNATVRGEIIDLHRRPSSVRAELHDGTDSCRLRWFNLPYRLRLHVGAMVVATGRVQEYDGRLEIVQPNLRVFDDQTALLSQAGGGRRQGVYRGGKSIKSPTIRRAVENVLRAGPLPVEESVPPELLRKHRLPTREAAIREMHVPRSDEKLETARRRLAYEEFLLMELAIALRRRRLRSFEQGERLRVTPEIDRRIRIRFPFALTPSQDKVVREIAGDLDSGRPMTRLLQGDVGSGKTVVALYACLVAIATGRQAAIMAPTEILARQHFTNIERYLAGSRVRFTLLRGGQGAKRRKEILGQIEAGELDLVVGTQALIQKDVAFKQLALVVVDEQHKFGVAQRHSFRTKGPMPHYLVMTATPIPRTLSMTVFGDLDVSVIRHAPPGRGRIITRVVVQRQWDTVMGYVRKRLEAGEQAYVVCPVIGSDEATKRRSDEGNSGRAPLPSPERKRAGAANVARGPDASLTSVREAHDRLMSGPWSGMKVALLHGAMKTAEKDATIQAFVAGELNALVATTVVEVGVDVPNATIMVVEHAERFGLSQLHQLRGRVGRGRRDALCVLIVHGRSRDPTAGGSKAAERLAVMAETTDGFKIAEADLAQRGPGELLGTRQHGLPELRIGDIVNDFALLDRARQDAFDIIRRDPRLQQPTHRPLIPALKRMFGGKLALLDAG